MSEPGDSPLRRHRFTTLHPASDARATCTCPTRQHPAGVDDDGVWVDLPHDGTPHAITLQIESAQVARIDVNGGNR